MNTPFDRFKRDVEKITNALVDLEATIGELQDRPTYPAPSIDGGKTLSQAERLELEREKVGTGLRQPLGWNGQMEVAHDQGRYAEDQRIWKAVSAAAGNGPADGGSRTIDLATLRRIIFGTKP